MTHYHGKSHIDQFISKLGSACYAFRTVKAVMTQETLRMICFSYIHSVMIYWYNSGGNSPYSINIFRIQRRI